LENLKEILETRELDRRKTSVFKPLGDINFSTYERASPSYVTIPTYYPIKCSGKTISIRLVTNDRWISVPYGSEES
jgi:histone deacetylase complex regulatory component SIN3